PGAVVSCALPEANDDFDPSPLVTANPVSGSIFPLGATAVTVTATDGSGNSITATLTVTVRDTTPPAVSVPANITAEASGAAGAVVTFVASASDLIDGATAVSCAPASGSTFALGTTPVSCTSTDVHAN